MTDISQPARDIYDQLPDDAEVSLVEIEGRLDTLVNEYRIPIEEASQNVLSNYTDGADVSRDESRPDDSEADSDNATTSPMREVARRVFAAELNDATYTFREDDDDRAPVYVLLPTGAKANRVFVVSPLTETADVGEENEYWQGRVVDPTGTYFVYAGQYQPYAAEVLRETEPPAYVAVVGKPRTYETDDGSVNVSLRPESITIVDELTRDRWVTETAERTLDRIEAFEDDRNQYARMAREQYGEAIDTYLEATITALKTLD